MGAVSALFAAVDGGAQPLGPGRPVARAIGLPLLPHPRGHSGRRLGAGRVAVGRPAAARWPWWPAWWCTRSSFLLRLTGGSSGGSLSRAYTSFVETAFDPGFLPAGAAARLLLFAGPVRRHARPCSRSSCCCAAGKRRDEAPIWWRIIGSPLSSSVAARTGCSTRLWQLVGGAAGARRPGPVELEPRLHRAASRQRRPAGLPRTAADGPRPRHAARPRVRAGRRPAPARLLPGERGGRRRPSAGGGIRPGRRQPRPPDQRGPGRA